MTNVLKNGDYVPDGKGGFERDETYGAEALFRLSCRRGAFPWLPDLGSELYALGREKPSAWETAAKAYSSEAVADLPLTVTGVTVTSENHGARVQVTLATEENETVEVTV